MFSSTGNCESALSNSLALSLSNPFNFGPSTLNYILAYFFRNISNSYGSLFYADDLAAFFVYNYIENNLKKSNCG
jgi:hypothetical protein